MFGQPFKTSPDCRLVVSLEVVLHCSLEAVTDTEKLCPQGRLGMEHELDSEQQVSGEPVSLCRVAV